MLEKLQSALKELNTQRAHLIEAGWFLQGCWLVQVKPGGTARTTAKYWQVRSRQPIFDGKTLKHLKPDEVEDYRAAIERGRQLKQIDRQIDKLQQKLQGLAQPTPSTDATPADATSAEAMPDPLPIRDRSQRTPQVRSSGKSENLTQQERLVQEVLADSQKLREVLRRSAAINRQLRAGGLTVKAKIPYREDSDE